MKFCIHTHIVSSRLPNLPLVFRHARTIVIFRSCQSLEFGALGIREQYLYPGASREHKSVAYAQSLSATVEYPNKGRLFQHRRQSCAE